MIRFFTISFDFNLKPVKILPMEILSFSHVLLFLILQGFIIFLFQLLHDGLSLEDLGSFLENGTQSQEQFEEKLNPYFSRQEKDQ